MDDLDRKLLGELQVDPRKSNARLAKSLGITEPTVRRRIEHLFSSVGLIFTALPDMKRFGYSTSAYIGLQIKPQSRVSEIAGQLCQSPHLRAVCTCEGFADLFVGGDFTSHEDMADFITGYLGKIDSISRIDTMIELQQVKERVYSRIETQDVIRRKADQKDDKAIDEADRRLVLELQKYCRVPLKKLAREIDLSEPTVYRRIKNLVASGAIELTAITNISKIGYPAEGFIGIEVVPSKLLTVAMSISRHPQVQYAGIYSGPIQILAAICAPTPEDLSYLATRELAKTEGIIRVAWLIHLKVLKRSFSWLPQ